jgi:hypothetical protein
MPEHLYTMFWLRRVKVELFVRLSQQNVSGQAWELWVTDRRAGREYPCPSTIFLFTSRHPLSHLHPQLSVLSVALKGQCREKWPLQLIDTSCAPRASPFKVSSPSKLRPSSKLTSRIGDVPMLLSARSEARKKFESNRSLTSGSEEHTTQINLAEEVAKILRENVVQGEALDQDGSRYSMSHPNAFEFNINIRFANL